jgi:uncharacterized protein (DUF342 family)
VEINGACLHSEIYAGGNLVIKGRLQGGTVCAQEKIYVAEQAGGGHDTATKVILGYNPSSLYALHACQTEISRLRSRQCSLEGLTRKGNIESEDLLLELVQEKLRLGQNRLNELSNEIKADEKNAEQCRLICAGRIRPGLEISIAQAYTTIQDFFEQGLEFYLKNNEVVYRPLSK